MCPGDATPPKTTPASDLCFWLFAALACLAILVLRTYAVDSLPGITGDELYDATWAKLVADGSDRFSWNGGTGSPINLVHFLLLVGAHRLFPPSFLLVKVPGLLFGILSIFVFYYLLRKSESPKEALAGSLFLWALPAHIIHTRLSQGPSESIFFTAVALLLALNERRVLSVAAFLVSVNVHPTNLFLYPILFLINLPSRTNRRIVYAAAHLAAAGAAGFYVTTIGKSIIRYIHIKGQFFQIPDFWAIVMGILPGNSCFRYIPGYIDPTYEILSLSFFACAFLFLTAFVGTRNPKMAGIDTGKEIAIFFGFLIASTVFFFIAGLGKMKPGGDRYFLWMVAPLALYLLRALRIAFIYFKRQKIYPWVVLGMTTFCILSVGENYFVRSFQENAGGHHDTFLTGDKEPKAEALKYIEATANREKRVVILAQNWWAYWPLRYLTLDRPKYHVTIPGQPRTLLLPRSFVVAGIDPENDEIYSVGFSKDYGSSIFVNFRPAQVRVIQGYGHRPIFWVGKFER